LVRDGSLANADLIGRPGAIQEAPELVVAILAKAARGECHATATIVHPSRCALGYCMWFPSSGSSVGKFHDQSPGEGVGNA
ncbi:MAG: hypothetical protein M3N19_11100, partial [Candidatus Eremiobacteraeota bacterium]|nr:hypothetical protein [Candidatus Eremiobacteraeota bacterium]